MIISKVTSPVGVRVYVDSELIAENCGFSGPSISFAETEVQAAGTVNLPVYSLPEAMEATLTLAGFDSNVVKAIVGKRVEVRFASAEIQPDGTTKTIGTKVFFSGPCKSLPQLSPEVGTSGSSEITFDVLSYQVYHDGEEAVCVDKLTGVVRVGGVSLSDDLNSLL